VKRGIFGACYFGNLTMIGSTANIVVLGILEKERKPLMSLKDWFKPGLVIAVPRFILATSMLYVCHFLL